LPRAQILQALFFAVLFGFALHRFGGARHACVRHDREDRHVPSSIVGFIMKVAPIGAFGAMAFTIGQYGVSTLLSLARLMGTFVRHMPCFRVRRARRDCGVHGFSIWKFVKYIKEELLIVLGTSSSRVACRGCSPRWKTPARQVVRRPR